MRFNTLLFLFILSPLLGASANVDFGFAPTAKMKPEAFAGIEHGPFGLPFVGVAIPKVMGLPRIPEGLEGRKEDSFVRVALKISAEGKVTDIKIIDAAPKGVLEKTALDAFQRMIFMPVVRNKVPIAYETDMVLFFRPKGEKKKS